MITPNKFTSLDRSVISKLDLIIRELSDEPTIPELYRAVGSKFETVQEFILAMDVLHILGKISVDFALRTVRHAD